MKVKNTPCWPIEANEYYERVTTLGKGVYGTVWMAKKKNTDDNDDSTDKCGHLVAVKNINITSPQIKAYVQREVEILSKVDHPHLIKLIQSFDESEYSGTRCIVMSLADGPNVQDILDKGGALGIPCARLISRHLVAAVSYLHVRAVTHRDLKPSNCVLVGASIKDKSIWSDDIDASEMVKNGKWKMVLVDFGLSRALSRDEIKKRKRRGSALDKIKDVSFRRNKRSSIKSVSREFMRMSAVGSALYIAPEILNCMVEKKRKSEAIASRVSDYGMPADAYALGLTIFEVLTGVPPEADFYNYIHSHTKKPTKVKKIICKIAHMELLKKNFRDLDQIPKEALTLIQDMTHSSPFERTTVREAQSYPWIAGHSEEDSYDIPQGDISSKIGDQVVFLK